jgi:N6-L-threonylcarbamoyladenine synthase
VSLVLGIETSCDETGVAVVEDTTIRSNVIASQIDVHARYGGVVPEIASRQHVLALQPAIDRALADAGVAGTDLDAVAVTSGPGLAGCLLVGVAGAKAAAAAWGVPLVGVNHLVGHVEAATLTDPALAYPLVALIVSGGHTTISFVEAPGSFEILGQTLDDAAGEAFDKIARYLGLGFPGGPAIDRVARDGNPKAHRFPRGLAGTGSYDVSLSGLKTAVIRWVREQEAADVEIDAADLAASFQEALVDPLVERTTRAARDRDAATIIAVGGVAANSRLRARLTDAGVAAGTRVVIPPSELCTDNGAMIAAAGARALADGRADTYALGVDPALGVG